MDGIYVLLLAGLAAMSYALLKLCEVLGGDVPAGSVGNDKREPHDDKPAAVRASGLPSRRA